MNVIALQPSPTAGRARRGVVGLTLLALLASMLVLSPAASASIAPAPGPATWGTNGTVFAQVLSGTTLYIGGAFTAVVSPDGSQSQPRSGLAAIDLATGNPTSWNPVVDGLSSTVYAMALSSDGATVFAGGDFATVGTEAHSRLAAIDATSGDVVSSWTAGFDGRIRALAVSGPTLYVGGSFEHWGTTSTVRLRLAAVDAASGSLLPWAPNADNTVRVIAVAPDGRILVGGFFTSIDGDATQQNLAALDASGAVQPWASHPTRPILSVAIAGGSVYAGGGGEPGGYAFANDLATGASLWSIPADGDVQAIGLADGRVVAGGHFSGIGSPTVMANHLAALDPSSGIVDTDWHPNLNGSLGVSTIVVSSGALYIGGDFTTISGASHRSIGSFVVTTGGNTQPSLAITSPADGSTFSTSDRVQFRAAANDIEDGDLTAKIVWSSSLDGRLGVGGAVTKRLSIGTHRITAKVRDSGGLVTTRTVSVTVTNSSPTVAISSPADGSRFSSTDRIVFHASASDFDEGDLSSKITWSSDRDGPLGSGASVTASLSTGTHVITAGVGDSKGATASATITVQVGGPNAPPIVTISVPQDGARIAGGTRVSFAAAATDAEQGDLTSSIAWTSSIDGPIGTGGSFTKRLSNGTHTIRAKVVDAGGLTGKATVTVTVGNLAPTVAITDPPDGTSVVTGTPVTFHGTASDVEDGDLTSTLRWTSNLDGVLGNGATVSATLSVGTHTITASATDSRGATTSATVTVAVTRSNTPPSIAITAPADGSTFQTKDLVGLSASATDAEDGSLQPSIAWTSNLDGSLGSGGSISKRLTEGSHVITASVTDAGGLTATASVTITVTDTPPQISITSPADGSSFSTGDQITLAASASDFDEGDLTGSIAWTSTIDGTIGTGGSVTRRLSAGTHTIRARVVDVDGVTAKASITVTVTNTPPVISIQAPANGATFKTSNSIAFQATASDADDGSLTPSIAWTSSLDGAIGTGGSFTRRLSKGTHTVTASVTDSGGITRTASVTITVANTPPTISINAPANGSSFKTSDTIAFSATAADFDDGDLTSSIAWSSSISGAIGSGGSLARKLPGGTHTITASVADAAGATRTASITITVGDSPPVVTIQNPSSGAAFQTSNDVALQASATDAEDGDLSSSISWTSSLDGTLGSGAALSTKLSAGTHTITASVTDSAGTTRASSISVTVANTPPSISIRQPADGASFTTSDDITLSASAADFDDGDLSGSVMWSSSRDGVLGAGATLVRKLSKGTHVITASVTDSASTTRSASVTVTVSNSAPTIAISSPTDGTSSSSSTPITFTASAHDVDQGDLSSSIVWSSDRQGQIGTGATFTRTLSKGAHTITASVTDADGATTSDSVGIVVGSSAPTISIQSPPNGNTYRTADAVAFQGSASDVDDGALTPSIVWTSSRDGQIGVGGSVTKRLSRGTHVITASITDSDGMTTTASVTITVTDTPPTLSLASPSNGSSYQTKDNVSFSATAADFEQGNLTSSIVWTSSRDGQIGVGGSFARTLSKGVHVVTASVTDADGATATASVTITVANTPPTVAITAPVNGASFRTADSITFSGTASDFDQGSLTGSIAWSSSRDGALGTGSGFTKRLSKGTHVITASVTDAHGATATASVTITVANTPPTVAITAPANGATFHTSDTIQFGGTASDFDQGTLTGSITWSSSRDGAIGVGGAASKRLSKGTHVITASVTDADGATTTAQITITVSNTPPTVSITSPANGSTVRTADDVSFAASASDFDQGSLTSSIQWTSSRDGSIGAGGSFTRKLSKGTHVITASVTDADGATTSSTVSITVANTPPTVSISSPSNGAGFTTNNSIQFTGTASDFDQGALSSSIVWRSSVDGQIGVGGTFTKKLSAGSHVITATVTDADGATATSSVSVSVMLATTAIVRSITYTASGGAGKQLDVTFTVVNASGSPLPNAAVSFDLYQGNTIDRSASGTTASDGTFTYNRMNAPSACYKTTVTALTVSGYTWDGKTPNNSFCKP